MAKIDLSGNSGWQSKSSDKIKSLQDGSYEYKELVLVPDEINLDWIEAGLIVQVLEGQLSLKMNDGISEYEKEEIIYLNNENIEGLEIVILAEVKLGVFKEKAQ